MRQQTKKPEHDEGKAKREPAGKASSDRRSSMDRADPYPTLPRRSFFRERKPEEVE